jgi:siderophore synthetase component
MQHMNKTLSPPTKPARVSVPVSAEALSAFQRLAKAGNMSTGRAIAEWLNDTVEAATFMATTMERARAAPKIVAAEMHAYALGLADETSEVMRKIKTMGKAGSLAEASAARRQAPAAPIPPSCNTGGKVPKKTSRSKGGKSGFPLPPAQVQAYADTNGRPPKATK